MLLALWASCVRDLFFEEGGALLLEELDLTSQSFQKEDINPVSSFLDRDC